MRPALPLRKLLLCIAALLIGGIIGLLCIARLFGALLPFFLLLGTPSPYIHPIEHGQDKISQTKFQFHKQSQQDQPEENLQEGDVSQERLAAGGRQRDCCALRELLACFLKHRNKQK